MPYRSLPPLVESLTLSTLRLRGFRSRRVVTSVGRVHLLDHHGEGPLPPLVMLHGFSSAGLHFLPLLRRLKRRVRRLVTVDLPGHGFSDLPAQGLDGDTIRAGLLEALPSVAAEPFVLFGASMGGFAALRYAGQHPEHLRGLFLCSPGGAPMTEAQLAAFRRSFELRDHDEALAFVDRLLHSPTLLRPLYAWNIRQRFREATMRGLLDSIRPEGLLTPEEVEGISTPTLLVWGRSERILPREGLDFFRAHLPARIVEPEGFGHSPWIEDPDAVARLVLDFLAELP